MDPKSGYQAPQPIGQMGISHAAIVFYRDDLATPYDPPKQVAPGEGASRINQPGTRPPGRRQPGGGRTRPGQAPSFQVPGTESIYAPGGSTGTGGEDAKYLTQTVFVIQFVWQYKPPGPETRPVNPPWSSGEDEIPIATELPPQEIPETVVDDAGVVDDGAATEEGTTPESTAPATDPATETVDPATSTDAGAATE
jgi:hypothetical protein